MTKINETNLTKAIIFAQKMDIKHKEKVCDEIFLQQPNLLLSLLALSQFECSMIEIEPLIEVLIVIHFALKEAGIKLKKISEQDQENELKKFVQAVKFTEGYETSLIDASIQQYLEYTNEPWLTAHVISVLKISKVLENKNENIKHLYMAAFCLIGCISNAKTSA